MKKILSVILCVALSCSCLVFSASATEQTMRRGLVDFEEIAMNRLTTLCLAAGNTTACGPFMRMTWQEDDGVYSVLSIFGTLDVDSEKLEIVSAVFTLGSTGETLDADNIYRFVSAISALECSDFDEIELQIKYKYGFSKHNNASSEYYDIYKEYFAPEVQSLLRKGVPAKDAKLVYSGNYDYYIKTVGSAGNITVCVGAQSR